MSETKWYEFQRMPDYIPIGQRATEEKMEEIRNVLAPSPLKSLLRYFQAL